jgi:calcineurin-like phosphoesterase family protein
MSKTWFISDTHHLHFNILRLSNRPFKDTQEMEDKLVEYWNALVEKEDHVYHLGDVAFANYDKTVEFLGKLNGNKFLIRGNHDKQIPNSCNLFGWVKDYYELEIDKIPVILFHYPMIDWNKKFHGSIALSGHTHSPNKLVKSGERGIHVGVDAWDYKPVSWAQIKELAEVQIDFKRKL